MTGGSNALPIPCPGDERDGNDDDCEHGGDIEPTPSRRRPDDLGDNRVSLVKRRDPTNLTLLWGSKCRECDQSEQNQTDRCNQFPPSATKDPWHYGHGDQGAESGTSMLNSWNSMVPMQARQNHDIQWAPLPSSHRMSAATDAVASRADRE